MHTIVANVKSLQDPYIFTSHGMWAETNKAKSRANTGIIIKIDAPDEAVLAAQVDVHLPNDHDFEVDDLDYYGSHDLQVNRIYDLPAHTPEDKGFLPGPHGHTYPEVDVLVTSSDGTVYPLKAAALLHPHAWQEAEGTTGTQLHLALGPTDGSLNTVDHMMTPAEIYERDQKLIEESNPVELIDHEAVARENAAQAAIEMANKILNFPTPPAEPTEPVS